MNDEDTRSATEKLGDDMKAYEHEYETNIPSECAFIVRSDGHSFSKFTRGFHQPFDKNFKQSMILTMNDCLNEFHAVTGYTHSDEITLIFAPIIPKNPGVFEAHAYNGRVCKILTLISSFISTRFNYHLRKLLREHQLNRWPHTNAHNDNANNGQNDKKYSDEFMDKMEHKNAYFDSRVLVFPPEKFIDINRHMIWRSLKDCLRNCISTYARDLYSAAQLHGKNSQQMIQMMKDKGFDFNKEVPENEKIGTYAKKELMEISAVDQKTGETVKVLRSIISNRTLRADKSAEFTKLLLDKYWISPSI